MTVKWLVTTVKILVTLLSWFKTMLVHLRLNPEEEW